MPPIWVQHFGGSEVVQDVAWIQELFIVQETDQFFRYFNLNFPVEIVTLLFDGSGWRPGPAGYNSRR